MHLEKFQVDEIQNGRRIKKGRQSALFTLIGLIYNNQVNRAR